MIYCTDEVLDLTPMYELIFKTWSCGNVHELNIEFAQFFMKLVGVHTAAPRHTTEQIFAIHEALCETVQAVHKAGFVKEEKLDDYYFKGGKQIEFYKLNPLFRTLIIIIDKMIPEDESNFEK